MPVVSIPRSSPFTRRTADLKGQGNCNTLFPDWCANDAARCTATCLFTLACAAAYLCAQIVSLCCVTRKCSAVCLPESSGTHTLCCYIEHTLSPARCLPLTLPCMHAHKPACNQLQHPEARRCLPGFRFGIHLARVVTRFLQCPNS